MDFLTVCKKTSETRCMLYLRSMPHHTIGTCRGTPVHGPHGPGTSQSRTFICSSNWASDKVKWAGEPLSSWTGWWPAEWVISLCMARRAMAASGSNSVPEFLFKLKCSYLCYLGAHAKIRTSYWILSMVVRRTITSGKLLLSLIGVPPNRSAQASPSPQPPIDT